MNARVLELTDMLAATARPNVVAMEVCLIVGDSRDRSPSQAAYRLDATGERKKLMTDGYLRWLFFTPTLVLFAMILGVIDASPKGGDKNSKSNFKIYAQAPHSAAVTSARFTKTAREILSVSADGTLKRWDIKNGMVLQTHSLFSTYALSKGPTNLLVLSERLVAVQNSYGTTVFDVETGELSEEYREYGLAFSEDPILYHKDGKHLLKLELTRGAVVSNQIELNSSLLDWPRQSRLYLPNGGDDRSRQSSVSISGNRVAVTAPIGTFSTARIFDTDTGERTVLMPQGRSRSIISRFSPVSGQITTGEMDETVRVWSAETGKLITELNGHDGQVISLAYSLDGKRLASGDNSGKVIVWNTNTFEKTFSLMHGGAVYDLSFSDDGDLLLSSGSNSTIKLWDAKNGRLVREFGEPGNNAKFAKNTIAISPSWSSTQRTIEKILGSSISDKIEQAKKLKTIDFSPNGDGRVNYYAVSRTLEFSSSDRKWNVEVPNWRFTNIRISPSGGHVVAMTSDRKLVLFSEKDGYHVGTVVVSPDGATLFITPEGFFDYSDDRATDSLVILRGEQYISPSQIHQALYRPDLVREKLSGDPDGIVKAAAADLDLEAVVSSGAAPQISITSPSTGSSTKDDSVSVQADVVDQGGGVGRVEWKVNGVTQGGGTDRGLKRVDRVLELNEKLVLTHGENVIELIVYNKKNLVASAPARISIALTSRLDKTPPKLFVLAVGINDYLDSRMRLTYAVADARSIADAFKTAGSDHYESVEVVILTDEEVTSEGLEKAFLELSMKVRATDVMLFYAAGHGKTVNGRYYYLPRDFRYQSEKSIEKNGIGQDKWQAWFKTIKARKSILIYDTCESGSLTSKDKVEIAMRSGLQQQAALSRLINATGRTVLTASTSDRPALEGYEGHGVFTYALLDGLARADRNTNGLIEVTELAGFVDDAVPKITETAFGIRQFPQMMVQGSDFALVNKIETLVAASPSTVIPQKATHVVLQKVPVFANPDNEMQVSEIEPATTIVILATENGWSLIARDGKRLGYIAAEAAKKLQ